MMHPPPKVKMSANEADTAAFCEPGTWQWGGAYGHSYSSTRIGDSRLRSKLIQCAWTAIRKDPELRGFYRRIYERQKGENHFSNQT